MQFLEGNKAALVWEDKTILITWAGSSIEKELPELLAFYGTDNGLLKLCN